MPRFLAILLLYSPFLSAQMRVDTNATIDQLVNHVLLEKGSPLEIENIRYTGIKKSIGRFSDRSSVGLINRGIILSTGNVFYAEGPNQNPKKSALGSNKGDEDLKQLAFRNTYDATVLEFDFIPYTDSISFEFLFASEEYPEYVHKGVNDVFAFFLSDREGAFRKNLAVVEDGVPVSVDNINAKDNAHLYFENLSWSDSLLKEGKFEKINIMMSRYYQYDGFTRLLMAKSRVIPGKRYHLKMAIADVGDRYYDSAVFLKANSFRSGGSRMKVDLSTLDQQLNLSLRKEIKLRDENVLFVTQDIGFAFDSDEITSFDFLNKLVRLIHSTSNVHVTINGHTDKVGTEEYNQDLSERRAQAVQKYLMSRGVPLERLKAVGFGNKIPVSDKDEGNRRVEFEFRIVE